MKQALKLFDLLLLTLSLTLVSCGDDNKENDEPTPPSVNPGGGSSSDPDDFDYMFGTKQFPTYKDEETGEFIYDIFVGFGVSGVYSSGINEFGMVVECPDGELSMSKDDYKDDTHHNNFGSGYYVYGLVSTNAQKSFGESVYVTTKKRNITLKFMPRWYNSKTGRYSTGATISRSFTPTPY